jgi:peroxiredoxin
MTQAWPWPAPEEDAGAVHLNAGTRLPRIALPSSAGVAIDLSRCQGRAVVFVYPFTGTPGEADPPGWDDIPGAHGSTPEAQGFRDLMPMFAMKAVKVFGLSAQASVDQQAFARREALTFALLSDGDLRFANALRLPRFATGGVTYLKRLTLIVRDGVIERTFYPVHPPHIHAGQVLRALA